MKLIKTGKYSRWLGLAYIFNDPQDTHRRAIVFGLWFYFLEIPL